MPTEMSPADRVHRCQQVLAHAWMVRTFIKHCDEAEDFPELMEMARSIFDLCRALDGAVATPEAYFRVLRKKLGKFRAAVRQFAHDAPLASMHMNFQQAVLSIEAACTALEELVAGDNASSADETEAGRPDAGAPPEPAGRE